jgi:L-2,4-diaminobutyrate decarboxylase
VSRGELGSGHSGPGSGHSGLGALLGDATPAGRAARRAALQAVADCLDEAAIARRGPYSGASPQELAELVAGLDPLPEVGVGIETALRGVGALAVRHAVDPAHPATAAHLHCAPLHAALAGELLAAATNPSLDSWDQAPVATHLEQRLVQALAAEAGYDPGTADGVLTSGGTQSNLMGLLLARDAAGRRLGGDVAAAGLGPEAARWRVLCSEAAHFSVQRAASLLGLGHRAVVGLATDADGRLLPDALDHAVARLRSRGREPIALVATAGTTDLGAIDPLPALAERARRLRLWLHVDAAAGGALLFSERHRARLDGLAAADSIAVDFHKLLWQPLACGLFLVRERSALAPLEVEVAYLNADEEGDAPPAWRMPHLVGKSLATSRRFDALKVLLTFQALGRRTLGALLDRTLELAATAAELVAAEPALALARRPSLNMVVFRYLPARDEPQRADQLNAAIRTRLLAEGTAVVGRTRLDGRVHLKLTLLNPLAGRDDLAGLVARVARAGADLDKDDQ